MQEYLGVYQARILHLVSLLRPPSSAPLVMASLASSMGSYLNSFANYLENRCTKRSPCDVITNMAVGFAAETGSGLFSLTSQHLLQI